MMDFSDNGRVLFLLFVSTAFLQVSPACRSYEVRKCEHYNLISSTAAFHAFIPKAQLDTLCRSIKTALECVYNSEGLKQCPRFAYISFDIQKSVIDAVCKDKKEEYLKSEPCFAQASVKNRIATKCMGKLSNRQRIIQDRCGLKKEVIGCVEDVISMTDGCVSGDAKLMGHLVLLYLTPSLGPCPIDVTETESPPTTTRKAITTTPKTDHRVGVPNPTSKEEVSFSSTDRKAVTITTKKGLFFSAMGRKATIITPRSKPSKIMEQKGEKHSGDNDRCDGYKKDGDNKNQCNLAIRKSSSIIFILSTLFFILRLCKV